MATREELENAILQADAAGDVASAQTFADMIKAGDFDGAQPVAEPDPIGAPLPSEQLTLKDRALAVAKTLGNEFADVGDFITGAIMSAGQVEQETNPFIPAESRRRISEGFQQNIDTIQDRSLARQQETEDIKAVHPIAGGGGQIAGEILSIPGPPGKKQAVDEAATALGEFGKRVFSGGAQGTIAGAVEPAATPEQRLQNAGIGGALGVGVTGVLEGAAPVGRKIINRGDAQSAATEEIIQAGERENVDVFFDDVTQSGTARQVASGNERVPLVGGEAGRIAQNQQAKQAAEARVKALSDEVWNREGDPNELFATLQESLQEKLSQVKAQAKSLYDAVGEKLDPGGAFKPGRVSEFINDAIKQEEARGSRTDQNLLGILESFRDAPELTDGGVFSQMEVIRAEMNTEISKYYRGENQNIGKKGVELLIGAKRALDRDLQEFAFKTNKRAWREFQNANKFYEKEIVPFKTRGLRELVKTDEPERIWRYLVANGGSDSRAVKMYRALTPKGRSAVRLGYVMDAVKEATGDKSFSTAKLATLLEKREAISKQFFQGTERAEIKGFTKLMRAIERSGQVAENPPTGNKLVPLLITGFAVAGGVPTALATAAGSAGLNQLFQTPGGRNFLLAAAKQTPGTAAFDSILTRLEAYLIRTTARGAAETGEIEPE